MAFRRKPRLLSSADQALRDLTVPCLLDLTSYHCPPGHTRLQPSRLREALSLRVGLAHLAGCALNCSLFPIPMHFWGTHPERYKPGINTSGKSSRVPPSPALQQPRQPVHSSALGFNYVLTRLSLLDCERVSSLHKNQGCILLIAGDSLWARYIIRAR